jgi:hypothetical protein
MKKFLELSKIIRNYIAKMVAGRSDDGIMITLKDPQKVDFQAAMMEDLLMRRGIDPKSITSEKQLVGIINQIKAAEKAEDAAQSGIRNTESAKVFDLEGNKLDPNKPIMGGKQEGMFDNIFNKMQNEMKGLKTVDDDLPPPGSRGGPDDIAAPVQSQEETLRNMTEAEIKREIEENNKSAVKKILERKNREDVYGLEDYDTTNMSEVKKQIIKLETRLGNLNPELPGFRDRARVLVDEIENLKNKTRDDKAEGGIMRLGLKEGSGMTRRTFLKFLAGAASIPIVGKILKPFKIGKTVSKVPIIKTADVPGKPEWFDQLVNKVILEGDDFTKKLATGERQVVHVKKLDEDTTVSVTQDMDNGVVRVEYDSPANTFEDTVQLQYKKPLPDEGAPNPAAEFEVAESGPVGRVQGPDDFYIDVDEVGGTSIRDLDSDVSKLKEYATGEKPSMKELVKNIERRKRARQITEDPEAQSDAVIRRQGDYDPSDYDDFASGGIARMLGE